jgi:hypothetical protein
MIVVRLPAAAGEPPFLSGCGVACFDEPGGRNRSRHKEMSLEPSFRTLRRSWSAGTGRWRSQIIGSMVFAAALLLAYMAGQWVLTGSVSATVKHLGLIAGLVIGVAVFLRWRRGVYFFLVWLTFEDLVRKYSSNNMIVYFAKDALLVMTVAGFLIALARHETRTFRPPFLIPLIFFTGLGLVQVFNPRSTSFFYGIMGMKLDFFYIPLMFLSYSLIDSEAELRRFLRITLWAGSMVALVGIIQASGYRNFLNPAHLAPELRELGHLARSVPSTGEVLNAPPSVFVSQGRYAAYLSLLFIVALAAIGYQILRRERGKLAYLVLALASVAIFLAGSRGALVYGLMSFFLLGAWFLWGTKYQVLAGARLTKGIRRSLLALALGMALVTWIVPRTIQGWWSLYYETLWPDSPSYELAYRVSTYPWENFRAVFRYPGWETGYGTGTSSLGAQYVTGVLHQPASAAPEVENGFGSIMLELGLLGPILWVWWGVALLVAGWKALERIKDTALYPVGCAILWYAFWLLFPATWGSIAGYQNFVMNAYLWVLVGILFRLPRLAEQARGEARGVRRDRAAPVGTGAALTPVGPRQWRGRATNTLQAGPGPSGIRGRR